MTPLAIHYRRVLRRASDPTQTVDLFLAAVLLANRQLMRSFK